MGLVVVVLRRQACVGVRPRRLTQDRALAWHTARCPRAPTCRSASGIGVTSLRLHKKALRAHHQTVDFALIASGALLGLAGAPHCAAMCSAPCAAAVGAGGKSSSVAFQLARVAGYALGGGAAAFSVTALAAWSTFSPALRPLWTLLNAAALVLGAWLLWHGRQPAWLARLGRVPPPAAVRVGGWQAIRMPLRAAGAGAAWVAWPCGLLQSALVVAALNSSVAGGAATMAVFALASAPGLVAGPWAMRRLLSGQSAVAREAWATRGAGLMLLGASVWALLHQLGPQVAAFCRSL